MVNQAPSYYGDAQKIDVIREDDELLVVREDGLFRISQDLLRRPKKVVEWDVAARVTRVLPSFTNNAFLNERRDTISAPYTRCLVDNYNGLLQFRNHAVGSCSWATLNGILPSSGKYWLIFNAFSSNGATPAGSFGIHVGSSPNDIITGTNPSDVEMNFFTPNIESCSIGLRGSDSQTIYTGGFNVILLDLGSGIHLHGSGTKQQGSSYTRSLASKRLHVISTNSIPLVERTFRWQASRPNEAMVPIPSGYQPLRLDNSSLPDNLQHGDVVVATSSGPFNEMWIRSGDRFQFLTLDTNKTLLVQLQSSDGVPLHLRDRGLAGTRLGNQQVLDDNDSLVISRHAGVENRILGRSGTTIRQNTIVLGTVLTQLEAIQNSVFVSSEKSSLRQVQDSTIVGNNLLTNSSRVDNSTVVGYNIDGRQSDILTSTLIGTNQLGNGTALQRAEQCVLIGDRAAELGNVGYAVKNIISRIVTIGNKSGQLFDGSSDLTYLGYESGYRSVRADRSVAVGARSFYQGAGVDCVAVGFESLRNNNPQSISQSNQLTAVGALALSNFDRTLTNSTAIGYNAQVTGSHQLQLGDSRTTVYSYSAPQTRSDRRDKADIVPTRLGLEFILQLKPVEYRLDFREDYIDYSTRPVSPDPIRPEPKPPTLKSSDPGYQAALLAYQTDHSNWENEFSLYTQAIQTYQNNLSVWNRDNNLTNIVKNGSKKRTRLHQGFLADEVRTAAEFVDAEFGGFQDHSVAGGLDVKSLGMDEFIPPIVKSIHELNARLNTRTEFLTFASKESFVDMVAQRVLEKMQQSG